MVGYVVDTPIPNPLLVGWNDLRVSGRDVRVVDRLTILLEIYRIATKLLSQRVEPLLDVEEVIGKVGRQFLERLSYNIVTIRVFRHGFLHDFMSDAVLE